MASNIYDERLPGTKPSGARPTFSPSVPPHSLDYSQASDFMGGVPGIYGDLPYGGSPTAPNTGAGPLGGTSGATSGGAGAGPLLGGIAPISWESDPTYLAGLGAINTGADTSIAGYRAREDAVNRALADMLPGITDRGAQSSENVKLGMESRGLLRSGETERKLADVAKGVATQQAEAQKSTTDQIADLEQSIASAQAAAAQARADLAAKYAASYATTTGVPSQMAGASA